jgi:uncharacterized protein (TIGR02172 family)
MITDSKPLALGRTAAVYAWKEGWVLKLFVEGWPSDWVEYEARIARVVHASGLPVPAAGEVIEVEGRIGLVYERVDGVSMMSQIMSRPWQANRLARTLAELHAEMHTRHVPELPELHRRLEDKINDFDGLPGDCRQAAQQALQRLPKGDQLCHGDFHPGNILMTARGPVIIDWTDATQGNPLADVARTRLLVTTPPTGEKPPVAALIRFLQRSFYRTYLERYFELRPGGKEQLDLWQPIVEAARLREGIPGDSERLIPHIQQAFKL